MFNEKAVPSLRKRNPIVTSPTPDPGPDVWTSPFQEILERDAPSSAQYLGAGEVRPDPTFGTPGQDTAFWEGQQQLPDDCAIKCQQFVLEQFTGHAVSEGTLVREAMENGWYAPGHGTSTSDVGNLLELHGVAVTHYQHADQFHLAMELAQGHKVIVGVESETLWHQNPVLDLLRDTLGIHGAADHAVVVSGIDTSDPQHVVVQVSDPGTGEAVASYPMEQFLEAWRGSDFFMVATQAPAPAHLPEMAHFDYSVGHIAEVAGVPYDQFLGYADHPDAYGDAIHRSVEFLHGADGQHSLHDPALAGLRSDHRGHPDPGHVHHELLANPDDAGTGLGRGDTPEVHHDSTPGPDHLDETSGHLGATDQPLDDPWHLDMS